MEDRQIITNQDYPNKYVDEEINCMKEIRKAYFMPKPEEVQQAERYYENLEKRHKLRNQSPHEINDSSPKMNKSEAGLTNLS